MSVEHPFAFRWDAALSIMVPLRPKQADQFYVDGKAYVLGIIEERSGASHRHYHAAIHEAWLNLPEELAARFPTETHLRKFALVKAGYADVQELVASSRAEALRIATYIRAIDEYAVVTVKDKSVQRFTARSQSYRRMGREDFQASKTAVIDIIASLIGVTSDTLLSNAQKAA